MSLGGRDWIFDVAHNTAAAEYLSEKLARAGYQNLRAVFSCMQDKPINELVVALNPYVEHWHCCTIPDLARCTSIDTIAGMMTKIGANFEMYENPESTVESILTLEENSEEDDTILVFGSFYLVSAVKKNFDRVLRMNDGLKQRIIGALVLIALCVIFIPVIFDEERIVPVDRKTQIPPAPLISPIPLPPAPERPEPKDPIISKAVDGRFEIEDSDAKPSPKPESESSSSPAKPSPRPTKVGSASLAKGWVLQVGSFSSLKRAEALREELIADGYQSFIRSVSTDSGERSRLFIGPTINKDDVYRTKTVIDEKYQVQSIVLRFKP